MILRVFHATALCLLFAFAGITPADEDEKKPHMAHFFAGLALIEAAPAMSDAEKASLFAELCAVTSVDPSQAVTYISTYRKKPKEWEKFQKKVLEILEGKTEKQKVKDAVNTTEKDLKNE